MVHFVLNWYFLFTESVRALLGRHTKILVKYMVKLDTKGDKTENRVLVSMSIFLEIILLRRLYQCVWLSKNDAIHIVCAFSKCLEIIIGLYISTWKANKKDHSSERFPMVFEPISILNMNFRSTNTFSKFKYAFFFF